MPWRGSSLDDVVVYCIACHPLLSCSAIVETIHPKDWKAAARHDGKRDPACEYQTMMTRLHRLHDQGKVIIDTSDPERTTPYRWRLMKPGEREAHEAELRAKWECPRKLRAAIAVAAEEMGGTAEFRVTVMRPSHYREAIASLLVRLPRGNLSAEVHRPEGNAWRDAAEECGLL